MLCQLFRSFANANTNLVISEPYMVINNWENENVVMERLSLSMVLRCFKYLDEEKKDYVSNNQNCVYFDYSNNQEKMHSRAHTQSTPLFKYTAPVNRYKNQNKRKLWSGINASPTFY